MWVARKIAATTRALSQRQAAEIDDRLVEAAATLPASRLLRVVEAMVLAADDTGADAAREEAMKGRFVTVQPGHRARHQGSLRPARRGRRLSAWTPRSTGWPGSSPPEATCRPSTYADRRPWAGWPTRPPRSG